MVSDLVANSRNKYSMRHGSYICKSSKLLNSKQPQQPLYSTALPGVLPASPMLS